MPEFLKKVWMKGCKCNFGMRMLPWSSEFCNLFRVDGQGFLGSSWKVSPTMAKIFMLSSDMS